MSEARGGLGKGLAALLPPRAGASIRELSLEEIRPNPRQPRRTFDDESLAELAESIRAVGLLQPIVVRQAGDSYELVVGERRWRASRLAGLERIPAIVREANDDEMLSDALIENLQRVDLNPLEEAAAYRQLVDDLGITHEDLAARVGRSRAAVTNALRLLNLTADVQVRIASGVITAAHGRTIAALEDPQAQSRAARRVVAEGLSVRETEEMIRRFSRAEASVPTTGRSRSERPAAILEAEQLLSDILETRVRVEAGRRRGLIEIEFSGPQDLDRIVRTITGEPGRPGDDA